MKKILNKPDNFVDEMVEGILLAHPDQLKTPGADLRIMVRADAPLSGKVGIITGGGSGHLPLFKGYVGKGLCDGVAIGNVFSSPSSQQCFEATVAVNGGAGVLYLYGNYGGDVFNFDLAADLAELEDIPTRTVLGRDDVASQPKERKTDRRGVADTGQPRPMRSTTWGPRGPPIKRRSSSRARSTSISCDKNEAVSPSAVAVSSTRCMACPAVTSAYGPNA